MNRKEIYGKGYTYVITRRIVQLSTGTVLRVRVRAYKGVNTATSPVKNDFKDYKILVEGDAAFGRVVKQVEEHCWS